MVKHLTPRKRAEVRGKHWAGATTREIANHFKRPMRTVTTYNQNLLGERGPCRLLIVLNLNINCKIKM